MQHRPVVYFRKYEIIYSRYCSPNRNYLRILYGLAVYAADMECSSSSMKWYLILIVSRKVTKPGSDHHALNQPHSRNDDIITWRRSFPCWGTWSSQVFYHGRSEVYVSEACSLWIPIGKAWGAIGEIHTVYTVRVRSHKSTCDPKGASKYHFHKVEFHNLFFTGATTSCRNESVFNNAWP